MVLVSACLCCCLGAPGSRCPKLECCGADCVAKSMEGLNASCSMPTC